MDSADRLSHKLIQPQTNDKKQGPGEVTGTLDCGRRLQMFRYSETIPEVQRTLTSQVQLLSTADPAQGLEFVRNMDRRAVGTVIIAPPVASLIFVTVWLVIYLRKSEDSDEKVDVQVVVTTAFTVASYLVTTGELTQYDHFDGADR